MGQDLFEGRKNPTFVVSGHPEKFINLLTQHGLLARLMRSRNCPCVTKTGSPSIYCDQCGGDGFVTDFQRKLLQTDEDSDVKGDRSKVLPFRIPILEPLSVERLLPPEQGDIKKYTIDSFDSETINISGDPLPYHWQKMRVSYYFDRYNRVLGDVVTVDANTKTLTTTQTLYDGEHKFGNIDIHGDIGVVLEVRDTVTGHKFTDYSFRKNVIQLKGSEPTPIQGQVEADYFYVPPAPVLPQDLETQNDIEKWITTLQSGTVRIGVEPWYELSIGDLITLLPVEFFRDDVIEHSSIGYDKLTEFDISRVDDEIFDEDGVKYKKGIDYYLRPFRDLVWIGNQPNAGKKMSVRFGYRPTYSIFVNNPVPNRMENKRYPINFMAKYFSMTLKDEEKISNPEYDPDSSDPKPTGAGFTQL